jgi:formate hydrogenlyase subunit 3/multisubunit Na+/H+ antiporter MnhD subunit
MKKDVNRPEFYVLGLLLTGLSLGIVFSADLILLFIFWVLSAACCWRFTVINSADRDSKAANKTLVMLCVTSAVMLAGFIMASSSPGTFGIPELKWAQISGYALLFIFIGIMARSYIFPLYAWFTDSGIAPSPAMALLGSAVAVNAGIYVFIRLFCQTFQLPEYFKVSIASLALISAFIAGCSALTEKNIRKILAYAAVSQAGLAIASLAIFSEISLTGALLFVLANALGMTGLIFCAGIVEQKTGATEINKVGGMIKNMPVTAVLFAVCAMSIAGIPPMLGFWGGFLTVVSAIKDGFFVLGIIHIICAVLTFLYLLKFFTRVFLGNKVTHPEAVEDTPLMLAGVSVLVFLLVVCGLFVQWPTSIVEIAKQQILHLF